MLLVESSGRGSSGRGSTRHKGEIPLPRGTATVRDSNQSAVRSTKHHGQETSNQGDAMGRQDLQVKRMINCICAKSVQPAGTATVALKQCEWEGGAGEECSRLKTKRDYREGGLLTLIESSFRRVEGNRQREAEGTRSRRRPPGGRYAYSGLHPS